MSGKTGITPRRAAEGNGGGRLSERLRQYVRQFRELLYAKNNDRDIRVLNAFRFVFFVMIYVHHMMSHIGDKVTLVSLRSPALGVSGFIVLSGFLNGKIYRTRISRVRLGDMAALTWKRIKRFYPLHFFLLLLLLPGAGIYNAATWGTEKTLRLLTNLTLTQSWVNDSSFYFGFNGVTWFLSVYIFLTFITLPILSAINKIHRSKHGTAKLLCLTAVLYLATMPMIALVTKKELNAEFFLYIFPPSRIFEYVTGMIFGVLADSSEANTDGRRGTAFYTVCEALTLAFLLAVTYLLPDSAHHTMFFDKRINEYLIPLLLLFYVYSKERGLISRLLSNNLLNYLGRISMYMMLTHPLFISFLGLKAERERLLILYVFALTVISAVVIDRIGPGNRNRNQDRNGGRREEKVPAALRKRG